MIIIRDGLHRALAGAIAFTAFWWLSFIFHLIAKPRCSSEGVDALLILFIIIAFFVLLPMVIGALLSLAFPFWQKILRSRSLILQSLLFWIFIGVLLEFFVIYAFHGINVASHSIIKRQFINYGFIAYASAAGVIFWFCGPRNKDS
jgi:hypothetical protein